MPHACRSAERKISTPAQLGCSGWPGRAEQAQRRGVAAEVLQRRRWCVFGEGALAVASPLPLGPSVRLPPQECGWWGSSATLQLAALAMPHPTRTLLAPVQNLELHGRRPCPSGRGWQHGQWHCELQPTEMMGAHVPGQRVASLPHNPARTPSPTMALCICLSSHRLWILPVGGGHASSRCCMAGSCAPCNKKRVRRR